MRTVAWAAVAALGLGMAVTGGASAQEHRMNFGTVLDAKHPVGIGMSRMAEVAEKQSGGRLKLAMFPSSQLGAQREVFQNTQAGLIGGVLESTALLANFIPQYGVLDLPYLVEDTDAAFKLLDGPVVERELTSRGPAAGFRIAYWEVTFRNIYTRSPVNTISDLKGRKIRVIPNPTFINLFRGFGAAPTPMAFGELYTALQQGVVDGAENDPVTYLTSKHYEVAKNYALTRHLMLIVALIMSDKQYQKLPEDLRAVLMKASSAGREATIAERVASENRVMAELKAGGVNITRPDLKSFAETGRKTWVESEQKLGKDLIAKITAAAGK